MPGASTHQDAQLDAVESAHDEQPLAGPGSRRRRRNWVAAALHRHSAPAFETRTVHLHSAAFGTRLLLQSSIADWRVFSEAY